MCGFSDAGSGLWSLDNGNALYQFSQSSGVLSVIPESSAFAGLLGLAALTMGLSRRSPRD